MERKFMFTNIDSIRINSYLKDLLNNLIKEKHDHLVMGDITPESYLDEGYQSLPFYIEIPTGLNGDFLVRESIEKLEEFITSFTNGEMYYYELLLERYNDLKPFNIIPVRYGIWLEF